MKTYINPETNVIRVLSNTIICASDPSKAPLAGPAEFGDGQSINYLAQ